MESTGRGRLRSPARLRSQTSSITCTRPDAAGSDQKSVSIRGCRKEFWPRIATDETRFRKPTHQNSNFLCNAAQTFGKKRETVCVSGLPERRPQTQNKKRKSNYEKQKKYPD